MSSVLRRAAAGGGVFVAVALEGTSADVPVWTEEDGALSVSYIDPVTSSGGKGLPWTFIDGGKTIYYTAAGLEAETCAPVDVRLMYRVAGEGVLTPYYVPLGTRVLGTAAQQDANVVGCWVARASANNYAAEE